MTRFSWLLAGGLAVVFLPAPGGSQATASMSGTVVDDSGAALNDALVLFKRARTPQAVADGRVVLTGPVVSSSVKTGGNGEFLITGVPSGNYYLCAIGTAPNHLKSCEWNGGSLLVRLKDGQAATKLKLTVPLGTLLIFKVQDPEGKIVLGENALAGGGGQNLLLGVISDFGHYARAQFAGRTATELTYTLAVPKDFSGRVFVSSSLRVTDSSGHSVDTSGPSLGISADSRAELTVTVSVQ